MIISSRSRRLARSATCILQSPSQTSTLPFRPLTQSRGAANGLQDPKTLDKSNPYMSRYMDRTRKAKAAALTPDDLRPEMGKMSEDSLLWLDYASGDRPRLERQEKDSKAAATKKTVPPLSQRKYRNLEPALDPNPVVRRQWLRKMVIRSVQRRGRLSTAEVLAQTERQSTSASAKWETSTKKLVKLANQIQGKTIEEAQVQMRFSKKKYAQVIRRFLEQAYNQAVVEKGMGLGKAEGRTGEPVEIELKNGKRKKITDRTEIYINRAFVGRGKYTQEAEFRAKGRINTIQHPQAMLTVELKEQATRIREHEERKEKRDNRKLWVHLPDRPVTAQRQYCIW